jgi:hypothetical protein
MCVPILWIIFGEILPHIHVNFEQRNVVLEFSINIIINKIFYSYYYSVNICHIHQNFTSVWWYFPLPSVCQQNIQQSTTTHSVLPLLEYWLLLADFHNFLSVAKGRESIKFYSLGPCLYAWVWGLLQDHSKFWPWSQTFPAFLTVCSWNSCQLFTLFLVCIKQLFPCSTNW